MADIVLVHGAWHGGWSWNPVARRLRASGHEVHAPTLTGVCERIHLATPETGVSVHVADIVNHIRFNELSDIVLVGHSYGGAVITGVASEVADRIAALVYLDAFNIEESGTSLFDNSPEWRVRQLRDAAEAYNGWQIPPDPLVPIWASSPESHEILTRLTTPHTLACFTEPIVLSGAEKTIADRTYILCADYDPSPFQPFYARYRDDPVWHTARIPGKHDAPIATPDRVAQEIDTVADRVS